MHNYYIENAAIKCAKHISEEISQIIDWARTDEEIIEMLESAGYTDFDIEDNKEWFEVSIVAHLPAGEVPGVAYPYLKQVSFQLEWKTGNVSVYFGEGMFEIDGKCVPA